MCGAFFYRSLPYIYAFLCIAEIGVAIFFLQYFIRNSLDDDHGDTSTTQTTNMTTYTTIDPIITTNTLPYNTTTDFPPEGIKLYLIAFGIGLLGSIVPLFTGFILLISGLTCCCCLVAKSRRRPFLRFVSLNCNCPCYSPRPKLRFQVRMIFHIICLLLRASALIMYKKLSMDGWVPPKAVNLVIEVTLICLPFPILAILLDIYHYRVWWAYEPDVQVSKELAKKSFSKKHKRFIPYVLMEQFRTSDIGNRSCKFGNNCVIQNLEHVVIFHSSNYQPQLRWSTMYPLYIGFHRTTPQAAFSIAKSDFQPSKRGMLGPGAYFARSNQSTLGKIGKANQTGAWFVAEIKMGEVFIVNDFSIRRSEDNPRYNPELHQFVQSGAWQENYDTCYFQHYDDCRDEFCVKDPANQIIRWVIVIEPAHDGKLFRYALDDELTSGCCSWC